MLLSSCVVFFFFKKIFDRFWDCLFLEMNVPSPINDEDNGEETYIDESDIINEYEIDGEGIYSCRCVVILFCSVFDEVILCISCTVFG